jgi:hypothetical protein
MSPIRLARGWYGRLVFAGEVRLSLLEERFDSFDKIRRVAGFTLEFRLELELRASSAFLAAPDFAEGIRAAVIDKDRATALLAARLKAELLVISTAVEKVALRFGQPDQEWVDHVTLEQAKRYLAEGTHFAKGSMAPKIEAIVSFLEQGGREALVTNPENVERALAGETGTRFTPD